MLLLLFDETSQKEMLTGVINPKVYNLLKLVLFSYCYVEKLI